MIEEEKIEVRTKVTVLGTAISQDSRFSDTYYKNHAHYKKITKKYQKKVDKIMSNYVIAFADFLYVSSLIGADTLIEWTNDGLSWESIVNSAEIVTTPRPLK